MLDYAREHQKELAEELKSQLSVRRITIQQYIVMMECGATSGSEIALLIIARMFKISIGVVRGDFMWLSEKIECKRCDVVIVQNCDGHFVGTKRLDGRLVNIGTVPRYQVNREKNGNSQFLHQRQIQDILLHVQLMNQPYLQLWMKVT